MLDPKLLILGVIGALLVLNGFLARGRAIRLSRLPHAPRRPSELPPEGPSSGPRPDSTPTSALSQNDPTP